jgi:16S rRNA G1207 methylase RsmC
VDVGCGYGPIALTLAARHRRTTVWAVDVNERALALCRANAEASGLENVRVARPDAVPADLRFSAVYCNPPIRAGKAVLHNLLETWAARLEPGGPLIVVVATHLGAGSLQRWMEARGWPTRRHAARAGYRVLMSFPSEGWTP